MHPPLSVSIITYNHEATIGDTIDSLFAAARANDMDVTILVRDQGSTDSTVAVLKPYNRRIQFEIGENLGYGGGHNALINQLDAPKKSREALHLILNPDIVLPGETLAYLIQYMMDNPHVAAVSPQIRFPDGNIQYLNRRPMTLFDAGLRFWAGKLGFLRKLFKSRLERFEMRDTDYNQNYEIETMTGCFMLYDLKILKDVGAFDTDYFLYFEDTDLSYRTSRQHKLMFLGEVHAIHHWGKSQYKSWRPFVYYLRSMLLYFRKWGWRLF